MDVAPTVRPAAAIPVFDKNARRVVFLLFAVIFLSIGYNLFLFNYPVFTVPDQWLNVPGYQKCQSQYSINFTPFHLIIIVYLPGMG
jgi:hypothetical protein